MNTLHQTMYFERTKRVTLCRWVYFHRLRMDNFVYKDTFNKEPETMREARRGSASAFEARNLCIRMLLPVPEAGPPV